MQSAGCWGTCPGGRQSAAPHAPAPAPPDAPWDDGGAPGAVGQGPRRRGGDRGRGIGEVVRSAQWPAAARREMPWKMAGSAPVRQVGLALAQLRLRRG